MLQQASSPLRGQLGKTRKTGGFAVPWQRGTAPGISDPCSDLAQISREVLGANRQAERKSPAQIGANSVPVKQIAMNCRDLRYF